MLLLPLLLLFPLALLLCKAERSRRDTWAIKTMLSIAHALLKAACRDRTWARRSSTSGCSESRWTTWIVSAIIRATCDTISCPSTGTTGGHVETHTGTRSVTILVITIFQCHPSRLFSCASASWIKTDSTRLFLYAPNDKRRARTPARRTSRAGWR